MVAATPTRVLVADHDRLIRGGLVQILERAGGFEVVGQAGTGDEAVRMARELRPDVVIVETAVPVKSGIDACREITATLPCTRVLILMSSAEADAVRLAVAAGAMGCLAKYSGTRDILSAVSSVARGERFIPGSIRETPISDNA